MENWRIYLIKESYHRIYRNMMDEGVQKQMDVLEKKYKLETILD
jgi:hypothetical protein